jgi:hypothetical protein
MVAFLSNRQNSCYGVTEPYPAAEVGYGFLHNRKRLSSRRHFTHNFLADKETCGMCFIIYMLITFCVLLDNSKSCLMIDYS